MMRAALVIAWVILGMVSVAHAEQIREIAVDGNTKTDDDTVALIARI